MTDCAPNPPSHAVICWCDDVYVYVQLRGLSPNHPYITKFPLCEAGMSKALHLLRQRYEEAPTHEKNYTSLPSGYVCESIGGTLSGKVYRKQRKVVQTDDQRAQTVAVLRKMGLV